MANSAEIGKTEFRVGDKIKLHLKIQEGDKIRTQPLEGLVIAIKGRGEDKTFTLRRIAAGGIGVERIFPLNTPWIAKIEVKKTGRVGRAKLYYLRKRIGKGAIRVKGPASAPKKRVKKDEKEKPGKPRRKSGRKPSS
jgi:large subunit ribosomal protein L19